MFNHATSLHDINAPFAYAITIPNDASVGAVDINDPLRSGLATSVMYTIAGPVTEKNARSTKLVINSRHKILTGSDCRSQSG